MLTMTKLLQTTKLSRAVLNKRIMSKYKIRQPSVSAWWSTGIPPARQIQLVRDFNLDPKILIK